MVAVCITTDAIAGLTNQHHQYPHHSAPSDQRYDGHNDHGQTGKIDGNVHRAAFLEPCSCVLRIFNVDQSFRFRRRNNFAVARLRPAPQVDRRDAVCQTTD